MISLIDTYLQRTKQENTPLALQNKEQNKYRTHVRAYRPIGHLIHTNPLSLREAFDSDKRSLRYFKDGINGHGNDYSIGKINDLTTKLGSLGIAGLIATSKGSPLQKGMEFVGLGCWLGAMHLWPKLAINTPIKALKGVDLNLEYETASGRRKSFYQDPQFICWDMLSDEEIQKMGDKLGVPTNIKNRRKAIENKARQIAIQGNTLALLTAGLSTPLIASLAADKLGKNVVYPLLNKWQEIKAESMEKEFAQHLLPNLDDYNIDAHTDKLIEKHVKTDMGIEDINAIKKSFMKKSKDFAIQKEMENTLNNIFNEHNIEKYSIEMTEETPKKIAGLIELVKPSKELSPVQLVENVLRNYQTGLNDTNLEDFIYDLKAEIDTKYKNRNIDVKRLNTSISNIREYLLGRRNITLKEPNATKENLKQLSLMSDVYHKYYVSKFRDKYLKFTWGNEVSTQASIWKNNQTEFIKALGISNSDLKEFLLINDIENTDKVLGSIFEKIIASPNKYEKTITRLSKFARKMSEKNDKFFPVAMNYLDDMTDMFANAPRKTEINGFATSIKTLLRSKRIDILMKYIGTDVTLYAPIRTLAVLKEAKPQLKEIANNNNIRIEELYSAVKSIMFNFQTTDAFINKLNNLKELIHTDGEFKKVLDIIFAKLPQNVERLMEPQLAARINDNTTLLKGLLLNLSDDVNFKFGPANNNEILKALRNLDLYKYVDDLFNTSFNNKDAIIESIMNIAKRYPEKLNLLQNIFRLTEEDMKKIANNDFSCIKNSCYFNNALYRTRDMLTFFGKEDLAKLGDITLGTTKMCQTNPAIGKTIKNLIKDSGQELLNYKGWFAKVGIAFVAVCGLTALAISQIGKKNEFNPDKYIERSKA